MISFYGIYTLASMKKSSQYKLIKQPFYLEGSEIKRLKKELVKQKLYDKTFLLHFKCDKYKRTPSSKKNSINCVAVSISKNQ